MCQILYLFLIFSILVSPVGCCMKCAFDESIFKAKLIKILLTIPLLTNKIFPPDLSILFQKFLIIFISFLYFFGCSLTTPGTSLSAFSYLIGNFKVFLIISAVSLHLRKSLE